MMDRPVQALQQSFLRDQGYETWPAFSTSRGFRRIAPTTPSSRIADGKIAYLHPQFVPRRNDRFDYTKPVDGSDPATDWGSLHSPAELPNVISPPNGWVQNTNTWPYRAAGAFSAKPEYFPKYMDMFGENYRGIHALKLLEHSRGWTLEGLRAAAYDSYQPGFEALIPGLVAAWDKAPDGEQKRALAEPIAAATRLGLPMGARNSVPMTLAAFWAQPLWDQARGEADCRIWKQLPAINQLPPRINSPRSLRASIASIGSSARGAPDGAR